MIASRISISNLDSRTGIEIYLPKPAATCHSHFGRLRGSPLLPLCRSDWHIQLYHSCRIFNETNRFAEKILQTSVPGEYVRHPEEKNLIFWCRRDGILSTARSVCSHIIQSFTQKEKWLYRRLGLPLYQFTANQSPVYLFFLNFLEYVFSPLESRGAPFQKTIYLSPRVL